MKENPYQIYQHFLKNSTSYALGADLGENLKRQQIEIDYDIFLAGLVDGMETEMVRFDPMKERDNGVRLQKIHKR